MANRERLMASIAVVAAIIMAWCWGGTVEAGPPRIKAGHDFTVIPANADYVPGQIFVRFAPKADGAERTRGEKLEILTSLAGGRIIRTYRYVSGLCLVILPETLTVESALKRFNGTEGIYYAELNYKGENCFGADPCDPRFGDQWALHNTGQNGGTVDADIDAPEGWEVRSDCCDLIIAVLDSGVDYEHEDLAGNMWVNVDELNGEASVDDDENGYVDDIYGYDFFNDDADPMDHYLYSHGTKVAGIAGAQGNNGVGIAGVSWDVKLMAVKTLSMSGGFELAASTLGIQYAIDKGANVLNCSWFDPGGYHQVLKDKIEAAGEMGILCVVCAHNFDDDSPIYPAAYELDNILVVMGTDRNDEKVASSNYSPSWVDLAAPGKDILSCATADRYQYETGTSMAAPQVAAACALVAGEHPDWPYQWVREAVIDSADKLESLKGLCVSEGRLNLYSALTFKPAKLHIAMSDDLNPDPNLCVGPDDPNIITYTISYGNLVTDVDEPNYIGDCNDVFIRDFLPVATALVDTEPNNPANYDEGTHSYTWNIGRVEPGDSCSVTITVRVTELAEPLGTFVNRAEIYDPNYYSKTEASAEVCCWECGDVVYVDASGTGPYLGTTWDYAYAGVQEALARAEAGCGNEIRVAEGTYKPTAGTVESVAFEMLDGVEMYGGYASGGEARDWREYATILSGDLGGEYKSDNIVTAGDVDACTVLDGFTISDGENGIRLYEDADLVISHCVIEDNTSNGIYCGIGVDSAAIIAQNIIRENADGMCIEGWPGSGFAVKNNWVHHNSGWGIAIDRATWAIITGNTVVYNGGDGIKCWSSYAGEAVNCIVWGNEGEELEYCTATYSCIEDPECNQVGNIHDDPCFVYDPNSRDFHLHPLSNCVDAGDPCGDYDGEEDIDDNGRALNGSDPCGAARVDMGADEVAYPACWWCRTQCHGDTDCDGDCDTVDWTVFRDAFGSAYPAEDYHPCADMDRDGDVDTVDWTAFRDNFGQSHVPNDCAIGGTWPPGGGAKAGGGGMDADAIKEMIEWLETVQPDGWKEFVELLEKLL